MILETIYNKILELLPNIGFNRAQSKTKGLLDMIEEDLNNEVIPTLLALLEHTDVLKEAEKYRVFKIYKENLKITHYEQLVKRCLEYSKDVLLNKPKLEASIKANLSDAINNKTITYRQFMLMSYIQDIKSNIEVMLRLLYIALRDEKTSVLSEKAVLKILKSLPSFRTKVLTSTGVVSTLKAIEDLANSCVYDLVQSEAPAAVKSKGLDNPTINNFIGNPIYKLGKWLVDREIEKILALKELKTILELRLYELRAELSGNEDNESLQKQIEYYEDKIASIDAKIDKIEKS